MLGRFFEEVERGDMLSPRLAELCTALLRPSSSDEYPPTVSPSESTSFGRFIGTRLGILNLSIIGAGRGLDRCADGSGDRGDEGTRIRGDRGLGRSRGSPERVHVTADSRNASSAAIIPVTWATLLPDHRGLNIGNCALDSTGDATIGVLGARAMISR